MTNASKKERGSQAELSQTADARVTDSPVPVLLGPTATGKTELLLRLSFRERIEVISCDSRQIYEGIPVGTAQPDARTLAEIPHHLVGFLSPSHSYSAGEFREDLDRLVQDVRSRGKIPLLCGGTGFYFRAARTQMIPVVEDAELRQRLEGLGHEGRLALLRARDEASLVSKGETPSRGRVHPNDRYRVERALFVLLQTGQPLRTYYEEGFRSRMDRTFQGVWLDLPDSVWRERVHIRGRQMIENGLVEEALRVFGEFGQCPALRTPGYTEAISYASGEISREDLEDRLIRSHLQYGRRQRVWFRGEPSLEYLTGVDKAIVFLEKLIAATIRD